MKTQCQEKPRATLWFSCCVLITATAFFSMTMGCNSDSSTGESSPITAGDQGAVLPQGGTHTQTNTGPQAGTGGATANQQGTGGAAASEGGAGGVAASSGGTGGQPIIRVDGGGIPSTGGAPSAGGAAGASGCFPAEMTIHELLETCVEDTNARDTYLFALENSHPDWSQFVADYFRCSDCGAVAAYIQECTRYGNPFEPAVPPDESSSIYDLCAPIIVYAGVRFT